MVRLNRIYTRTGDDGTSGLVDGSRLPKHALRFEAVGAVDEANSMLGWAVLALNDPAAGAVTRIQNDLFDLGADLATPLGGIGGDDFVPSEMVLRIVPSQVEWLEQRIDAVNDKLEPLRSFILPGGTMPVAHLHLARTIVRRAERTAWSALEAHDDVNPLTAKYLNRLSDLMFILCRAAADGRELLWKPGGTR